MANLKGSTFDKQQKDMNFKLFALGKNKGGDSLTHSEALLVKRDMYFKDFAQFLESQNMHGKLNQLINEDNLTSFLNDRLSNLGLNSRENYLSGFNSLLNAFKEVNIEVNLREDYFKNKFAEIKQTTPVPEHENRGLPHDNVLNDLKELRHESYVIGKIMIEQGYRISEAMRIVSEPDKYIKKLPNGDYIISEVIGKGGKMYQDKILSHSTYRLINNLKNIPSKSAFNRDLKLVNENLRAHDFRYEYARNLYNENIGRNGVTRALELVSKALNHNRLEISKYYLQIEGLSEHK